MPKRRMIIIWLISSTILTILFTATLGVLGRVSIIEYIALFIGSLFVIAFFGLLFRALWRLGSK